MIVISDTSPITNLAAIGKLDLLHLLYGSIVIPTAVYNELTNKPVPGTQSVKTLSWIKTQSVPNLQRVNKILNSQNNIHQGEAEAIILAIETKANLLLMDEKRGRNLAKSYQIPVTGLLGILLQAKQQGAITSVKNLIDELRQIAEFRISQELYQTILQLANE